MLKDAEKFHENNKLQKNDQEEESRDKAEETGVNKDPIVVKHQESNDDPNNPKDPEWIRAVVLLQRLIKGRNEQNKM